MTAEKREREAVVKWLRHNPHGLSAPSPERMLLAKAIERGEHLANPLISLTHQESKT